MLDTNRMPKDLAIEEKINDKEKVLEAENEIRALKKVIIKDKILIIKILQTCMKSDCNLADQIFALVKNARKEEDKK